jgi:hypothetical protein
MVIAHALHDAASPSATTGECYGDPGTPVVPLTLTAPCAAGSLLRAVTTAPIPRRVASRLAYSGRAHGGPGPLREAADAHRDTVATETPLSYRLVRALRWSNLGVTLSAFITAPATRLCCAKR